MKFIKSIIVTALLLLLSVSAINAQEKLNLLAEFSLFYESFKNKDFESAEPHGWIVIDTDPSKFLQYRPFKKMEEILKWRYDSLAITEDQKDSVAGLAIKLYDRAIEVGAKDPEYFIMRKAYVIEQWSKSRPAEKVEAYISALEKNPDADPYYKDRLGILYYTNATEENGYKLKALELYMKLAAEDPENPLWLERMKALAEDPEELVSIMKKAWDLDKDNLEKAWQYAEICSSSEYFEKAIEPLEFLVAKSPEVVTYWKRLASLYQKEDRTDDAIKAYKKLIELDLKNRDNYFNIAIIYNKLNQFSVARSYLQKASKASEETWDMPLYVEAQLYEKSASQSGTFEFMDKCVYKLASDTYVRAARVGGPMASLSVDRVKALKDTVPQKEDYFFRKYKSGDKIKIEGDTFGWINRSITVK